MGIQGKNRRGGIGGEGREGGRERERGEGERGRERRGREREGELSESNRNTTICEVRPDTDQTDFQTRRLERIYSEFSQQLMR